MIDENVPPPANDRYFNYQRFKKKLVFVYLWQMKVTQQELETRKTHAPDSTKPPKENKIGIQIRFTLTRRCRVAFNSQEKNKNKYAQMH